MPYIKINFKKLGLLLLLLIAAVGLSYAAIKIFFPSQIVSQPGGEQITAIDPLTGLPVASEGAGQIIDQSEPGELASGIDTGSSAVSSQEQLSETAIRDNKISDLTDRDVLAPALTANNTLQYYNKAEGLFYYLDQDGQAAPLSDQKFYAVEDVVWSPQQDKAVIEYPDGSKIIYDFNSDQQVSLPKYWEEFQWSPAGDQLVFKSIGSEIENRWLAIVNSDGSGSTKVEKIGANSDKVITSWSPNNQIVAMMSEGLDADRKTVYFIGLRGENFRSMTVAGRGFTPLWSPQGDKLVYSVYSSGSNYQPELWQAQAQGDNIGLGRLPVGLSTWADKCVFLNNTQLYCAVPRELPEGAGLLPDLAFSSADDLYFVDLTTSTKNLISLNGYYNLSNLMLSADQKILYFTDKMTGRLHQLEL